MINLNNKLALRVGNELLIGHGYFTGLKTFADLFNTFYFNIIPLLQSYFPEDINTLKEITGTEFFDETNNIKYIQSPEDFIKALQKI